MAALLLPGSLDKIRKLSEASDNLVSTTKGGKIIDKAFQVFSPSSIVSASDIKTLQQKVTTIFDSDPENDIAIEDLFWDVTAAARDTVGRATDAFINLPSIVSGAESLWAGVIAIVEGLIEKVTALELSALVGLGERYIFFAPVVAVAMYWQMTKGGGGDSQETGSDSGSASLDASKSARGQLVLRHLARVQTVSSLLEAISNLGPGALDTQSPKFSAQRREVQALLARLLELNPRDDPRVGLKVKSLENEVLRDIELEPQLDGKWKLLYVGDPPADAPAPSAPSSLLNLFEAGLASSWLRQLGMEAMDLNQELAQTPLAPFQSLRVHNWTNLKMNDFGVFEVSLNGTWQQGGEESSLVFDGVSLTPKTLFGSPMRDDLPALSIPIPMAARQRVEHKVLLVADDVRVETDSFGSLLLYTRRSP